MFRQASLDSLNAAPRIPPWPMYKLLLSLRYFRSRFVALAALLAVTFGVAMLRIVLSVMGGYMVELREIIRGQESHLQLRSRDGELRVSNLPRLEMAIGAVENVRASAPFIERLAVCRSGIFIKPCQLKGVDPEKQPRISDFGRHILRPCELEAILEQFVLEPSTADGGAPPEVDLQAANRAARELIHSANRKPLDTGELEGLFSKQWRLKLLNRAYGDHPELLDPDNPAPAALVGLQPLLERQVKLGHRITVSTLNPRTSEPVHLNYVVAGALKTRDFQFDSETIYVLVDRLKNDLELWEEKDNRYRYQGIRISLEDPSKLEETRKSVETAVEKIDPRLEVTTWKDLRTTLLKAVNRETVIVYVIVFILVLFTGSLILLMLILTVIEKTRDIGVLMALGATPNGVTSIFLLNGMVICTVGMVLGLGLGHLFCSNINEIHDAIYRATGVQLFPPEIYHMDRIPIAFEPVDILQMTIWPVAIGFLASLIPAVWAPRRDPIKAIQYK